jgi:branched-chain amino acid transport system permease protein
MAAHPGAPARGNGFIKGLSLSAAPRRGTLSVVEIAVLAACIVAALTITNRHAVDIMIRTFLWGGLALAWNIAGGYAGLISFGHAAFFGIGAYTSTLLFLRAGVSPWLGMLAGGALAAAFGLFAGYLSFRYGLRGPYFSLVTLAFAEMLRVVAVNAKVVGASLGLVIPSGTPAPSLFVFAGKLPYYYVILAMTGLALLITRGVARGRLGYALIAVRENEDAAEAAGVNALGGKLAAMALSSFLTALGGTFYAQYFAYIDPTITFGPAISIQGLLPAIVGGAGTVLGPLLGSFVLTPISELTRAMLRGRAGADIMLYGLILVLVISFLPQGLMGWRRAVRRSAR